MTCGADLSDPEVSTRTRAAVRELFDALKTAVEGHYRVTDMLGRGGMGAVFLAEDLRLGRTVAVKVLRPDLASETAFVGRFEREARIAARLDHANIIPIYSVEEVNGLHYFVMKYIAGKSLDDLLKDGPLALPHGQAILWQVACGLGHAHQRGVIHRDVKPSNIMIDEGGRALVTDFGISKALHQDTQYTSTGQMVGTPRYISPEQAQGLPLDGRSDQYSLAVVGYQLLVGHLPLVADSVHALMYKHIYEIPPSARSVRPDVPEQMSDALQRAMSKDPGDRFPTMEEFATALWPERPVQPGEPTPTIAGLSPLAALIRSRRPSRRRLAVLAGIAVGHLLAFLVGRRTESPSNTPRHVPGVTPVEPRAGPAGPSTLPPPSADTGAGRGFGYSPSVATPEPAVDSTASVGAPSGESAPPPPAPPPPAPPKPARQRPTVTAPPVRPAPAVTSGFLTINAVPYGTVSIDGVEIGDTPIVRRALPPGEHTVRIARPGFRTETVPVTVTAGNEVRISRSLLRDSL
jgi:serine/threonine protein kinase